MYVMSLILFFCASQITNAHIRRANVFSLHAWTTSRIGQFYEEVSLIISPRHGRMTSNASSEELLQRCSEKNTIWDFWIYPPLDRRAALLSGEFSWLKVDIYFVQTCGHKLPRLPLMTMQQKPFLGMIHWNQTAIRNQLNGDLNGTQNACWKY